MDIAIFLTDKKKKPRVVIIRQVDLIQKKCWRYVENLKILRLLIPKSNDNTKFHVPNSGWQ